VRLPETRQILLSTGVLRLVVGGALIAAPGLFGRLMGLSADSAGQADWVTRMVGGREAALGAGTLLAAARGQQGRSWLLGQMLSDAGDAAFVIAAARQGKLRPLVGPAVVGFAALGVTAEAVGLR
jgi:hypothetical protein